MTVTKQNPSLSEYEQLQELYSTTLKCPCSNMIMPYSTVISFSVTLHEVCKSDFVNESWILLMALTSSMNTYDGLDDKHFRLLSFLCDLINETIDDAIRRFTQRSLITPNLLTATNVITELDTAFNQTIQTLVTNFNLLVNISNLFNQVDQPFTMSDNAKSAFIVTNSNNSEEMPQVSIRLASVTSEYESSTNCICATHPHCQRATIHHDWKNISLCGTISNVSYVIPGMTIGCFILNSLLLSTLECLYSECCLSVLNYYINVAYMREYTNILWFDAHHLVYNPASSRFPPNTSIKMIIKEMMIEQRQSSFSFPNYYATCAPIYCAYSDRVYTYDFLQIVIKLISIISGLTVALRIFTPLIVNIVFYLLKPKLQTQPSSQVRPKLTVQIRKLLRQFLTLLYTKSIDVNIFPLRTFENHIDRRRAKRLGQLATRLYIILLIISLVIATFYTIIEPRTLIKTFDKPSLDLYNELLLDHNGSVQCPCSTIATTYQKYVVIEPVFHQICSNSFAVDQWRENITASLVLSNYDVRDYRRFLSAHLQFLIGLCDLSMKSVTDSISQFLSSLFITTELQSPTIFQAQIHSLINKSISNAPVTFARLLALLRTTNHGNAFITTYGTNFQYYLREWIKISPNSNTKDGTMALTRAVIYDNNCSCALNKSCTTSAVFTNRQSSSMVPIKGFKMGCTPTESFLRSTLECFYDLSCINLIQNFSNYSSVNDNTNITLYLTNSSHFSMNTTFFDLINQLFVETWSATTNHSAYFYQCSPILCSYTYIQQLNSLYTVTLLLGLYGGLSIVLKWITPNIVYILAQICHKQKNRSSVVNPKNSTKITTIATIDTVSSVNLSHAALNSESVYTTSISNLTLIRFLLFGILIIIPVVMAFIGPVVYLHRHRKHLSTSPLSSTSTSQSTVNMVTSFNTDALISSAPSCELTFQTSITYTVNYTGDLGLGITMEVGNFNDDDWPDIVFTNFGGNYIGILIGNGDGTFGAPRIYWTGDYSGPYRMVVFDFDHDNHLDLAVMLVGPSKIGIFLGRGDGTFATPIMFSLGSLILPNSIAVADFNRDNQSDLCVCTTAPGDIMMLLGNRDGSFVVYRMNSTYTCQDLAVGDFNNDGELDIAVVSLAYVNYFNVFFGNGRGNFTREMVVSIGQYSLINSITVGDFNHDNQLDLAVADFRTNNIWIMFQDENGTFQTQVTYSTGYVSRPYSIITGDFNNDHQPDLAITNSILSSVCIFLGLSDGTFFAQKTFSLGAENNADLIKIGDFNNDNKLDVISTNSETSVFQILLNSCDCCVTGFIQQHLDTHK
ncbi:unnamed protein product [Adineta ricciae]|nr:unnamed protein product [Adineta ricciae]